jgi:hypothetical protein
MMRLVANTTKNRIPLLKDESSRFSGETLFMSASIAKSVWMLPIIQQVKFDFYLCCKAFRKYFIIEFASSLDITDKFDSFICLRIRSTTLGHCS